MTVRVQPGNRWHTHRLNWKECNEKVHAGRTREWQEVMTCHRRRLLSPRKGQEEKMTLPDYGEGITSYNREREVTR